MSHYIHNIDPIFFTLGPIQLRWYGLMYLIGFSLGFLLARKRYLQSQFCLSPYKAQDVVTFLLIGMIFGARLAYVYIYNPEIADQGFLEVIAVWKGGLAYHGAAAGFALAMWAYSRIHKIGFLHLADMVVQGAALGVFFGRIGNFLNGELFGRVATDVPWAVIFPSGGTMPRHPSQLYQALGEGLFVFVILQLIHKYEVKKGQAPSKTLWQKLDKKQLKNGYTVKWQRTGILASAYFILYGIGRFAVEFFREPDPQLGYYWQYFTMGQILCAIMIVIGTIVLIRRIRHPLPFEYTLK